MVELLKQKTGGDRKVLTVDYDLRKEDSCKQLISEHLSFHRKLDALYVKSLNNLCYL